MSIYQRIILVLGAIALVIAILTTPQLVIVQGTHAKPTADLAQLQPIIAPWTALIRSIGVIGVTVLLFFALKGSEVKKRVKKSKLSKQN
ncbi:MAG: hypothetical protein JRI46_07340 [Deltaproteobacteria bacterium]|nr:hypothetical protein [Deltaproteobacteria bacterium]